jgi:hypothetical protein
MREVLTSYEDWDCLVELSNGDWHALVTRARIGGREVEVVDLMRQEGGKVVDFTAFSRPLDGTATFAAVIAPRFAARRGRIWRFIVALLTRPLPRLLAFGDRLISRLAALHSESR